MNIKRIVKSIAIAAIFLTPLFPFAVASSLAVPFVTGPAFYFRILIEIAFAGWVVLALLDSRYRPRLSPLFIAVSILAAVMLLADLFGVDPLHSLWSNFDRMDGWINTIHLWAMFIIMSSMFGSYDSGKKLWHSWLNVSLLAASIVAIHGLFQYTGWVAAHFQDAGIRIDSSFGNPTFLAVYLLIHFFIALYLLSVVWSDRSRGDDAKPASRYRLTYLTAAYSIFAVLSIFDIFETGTRGTFLGLAAGIMITLALYALLGKSEPKKRRLSAMGIVCLVILTGLIFWANRDSQFVRQNGVLSRFAAISWNDGASGEYRQYIWTMALEGFVEKPILGWGQENFTYVFQKNYDPKMPDRLSWYDRAHDVFLDQIVSSGAIGLVAYLALYVLFLIAVWKSQLSLYEKCLLTGLLSGYAVHNLFVFDSLSDYVPFFAMLAFADSFARSKRTGLFGDRTMNCNSAKYFASPVVILILAGAVYFFNMRPLLANEYLGSAVQTCSNSNADVSLFDKALSVDSNMANRMILTQLIPCSESVTSNPLASGSVKQSFIDLASRRIKAEVDNTPNDAYVYYLAGPFLKQIGQFSQAESLLTKGHELMPGEQAISFELASVYLYEGRSGDAADLLKQAYESDPSYSTAASAYTVALVIAGREDEARQVSGADQNILNEAVADVASKSYPEATALYQSVIAGPESVNVMVDQARIQYAAGNVAKAIDILRGIESSYPQAKDQIEAAIKQVQP